MLTTDDFLLQYETLPDEELYAIDIEKDHYSPEAQEALAIIIRKRGGPDALIQRLTEKQRYTNEVGRVYALAAALAGQNIDRERCKIQITSSILTKTTIDEAIDKAYTNTLRDLDDRKIKPRTIIGSILGIIVAGAIGGVCCWLEQRYAPGLGGHPLLILFIGLILLCYGIVRLFTRQSRKNLLVLIATVLSILLAVLIGAILNNP